MSLQSLKVSELKNVAEEYGVDIEGAKNKQEILAMLAEEGVTDELLDKLAKVEKEELKPLKSTQIMKDDYDGEIALVKMERKNKSYETHGFYFTQADPFVSMPMSVAVEIFKHEEGFRLATPVEVKEFYS